ALEGDVLVVGAPNEASAARGVGGDQDDDSAYASGAVYVFRRAGTTWAQEAYLKASNSDIYDGFGENVALSGDTLAVGAIYESSAARGVDGDQDNDSAPDSGAVYVFRRTGAAWQQEAYLKASNSEELDEFGSSLALSGDTLAVGVNQEDSSSPGVDGNQDDDSASNSGAAYVFGRTGATWQQQAYLKASNPGAADEFGYSVALSGDTLAVGSRFESGAAENAVLGSGAVYVFGRTGATWEQQAYLKASNPGEYDVFGTSVALSGDTLAVGATGESSAAQGVDGDQADDAAENSGAVYVFRRAGTDWQQQVYLKASNTGAHDAFGASLALSGDTLVVGAPNEEGSATGVGGDQTTNGRQHSGAVYIFH
ncbi:MAG TPA: FG-GAP repeat protein, partial [Haliangium sp.]|nr:FG-GAP repeat protein [Haliangium sp.]